MQYVTQPPQPSSALQSPPDYDGIARLFQGSERTACREVLSAIGPLISFLPDNSGRIVYLDSGQTSTSTILSLLKYFISEDNQGQPPDARAFLRLLKLARVKARYLRHVFGPSFIKPRIPP